MNKRISAVLSLICLAIIVVAVWWWYDSHHGTVGDRYWGHCYGGTPKISPKITTTVLGNIGYTVVYDELHKNPAVVCYVLRRSSRLPYRSKRPSRFIMDDRTQARTHPRDYSGSGYDRGHMAPNYAIGRFYGRRAQLETFLMSNIVPQRHTLNDGVWAYLEKKISDKYALQNDLVYVLTGPVYTRPRVKHIKAHISVPDEFFLVVVRQRHSSDPSHVRIDSYMIPQSADQYAQPSRYTADLASIESATGIDLLPELDSDTAR